MRDKDAEHCVEETIKRIQAGNVPLEELRAFASDDSAYVRANAIEAIIARHIANDTLALVSDFVNNKENHQVFMGTVSLAQVIVGCLLDSDDLITQSTARTLIEAWPEAEKNDLSWFLRNR